MVLARVCSYDDVEPIGKNIMLNLISEDSAFSVLKIPSFRRIWIAGGLSALVRWLDMLAIGIFTYQLTEDAGAVAFTFVVRMFPRLLFGLFVGALSDRFNRKYLWVGALLFVTTSYLLLGLAIAFADIKYWQLLCFVFLLAIGWSIEFPNRKAIIADTVPDQLLGRAIGIEWSTDSLAKIPGPLIAGGLIAFIGAEWAYLIGALIILVATAVASTVVLEPIARNTEDISSLNQVKDGLRYVRFNRLLLGALGVTFVFNLAFPAYNSLLPAIGRDILNADPFQIGILGALEGLGAVLGSLWIAQYAKEIRFSQIYYAGTGWFLICAAAFAFSEIYLLSAACIFLLGFGFAAFATMQTTLLIRVSSPEMRGRVLGALSFCIGLGPLTAVQIGPLVSYIGFQYGLFVVLLEGAILLAATAYFFPTIIQKLTTELIRQHGESAKTQ